MLITIIKYAVSLQIYISVPGKTKMKNEQQKWLAWLQELWDARQSSETLSALGAERQLTVWMKQGEYEPWFIIATLLKAKSHWFIFIPQRCSLKCFRCYSPWQPTTANANASPTNRRQYSFWSFVQFKKKLKIDDQSVNHQPSNTFFHISASSKWFLQHGCT